MERERGRERGMGGREREGGRERKGERGGMRERERGGGGERERERERARERKRLVPHCRLVTSQVYHIRQNFQVLSSDDAKYLPQKVFSDDI